MQGLVRQKKVVVGAPTVADGLDFREVLLDDLPVFFPDVRGVRGNLPAVLEITEKGHLAEGQIQFLPVGHVKSHDVVLPVLDMAQGTPEIVYKQSLHDLGWPLDPQILEILRNGQEI